VTNAELQEQYFPVVGTTTSSNQPFEWADPAEIPVRDWLYGKHLIRRHVSATIASCQSIECDQEGIAERTRREAGQSRGTVVLNRYRR
jgi:hypothetical protein